MDATPAETLEDQALAEFLLLSEDDQLVELEIVSKLFAMADLVGLHNAYLRSAARNGRLLPERVVERLFELVSPDEVKESRQETGIRNSLTPFALKQMREETYKTQVRPLLTASPAHQDEFINSLDEPDLRNLLLLLLRYGKECGRSARCRDIEQRIQSRAEDVKYGRAKPVQPADEQPGGTQSIPAGL